MQEARPKKILFLILHPGFLRFFDTTIPLLLDRGHTVHLAFTFVKKKAQGIEALGEPHERLIVDQEDFPGRTDGWRYFANTVRAACAYVRYLDDSYRGTSFLRDRIGDLLPPEAGFLKRWPYMPRFVARAVRRLFAGLERLIPTAANVDAYIRQVDPDLVLVSPLVDKSGQAEIVKSAAALGIPAGLCVGSWDHLTSKGLIHPQPDRIFLWNEAQKREAIELHDVEPGRVVVTGAQPFDMWFDRKPALSRAEFCRKVGLPSDKPYVLFACSSPQINKPAAEVEFIKRWIAALRRELEPRHRDIAILIRPHPTNFQHWVQADAAQYPGAVIYPRYGANPVNNDDRADYFDAIYHSAAVVGINTSAMVEAPIQGKPVMTILADDFGNQRETLHFRLLLPENGGCLEVADTFEQHARQLDAILDDPASQAARLDGFVDSFLRPCGRDRPAVQVLVDCIERLAALPRPATAAVPWFARPLSALLAGPVARAAERQEAEERRAYEAKRRHKAQVKAEAAAATAPTLEQV